MKRFYKVVSARAERGGFVILLDGKPVKTPLKNALSAPSQGVADVIVQEWAGQGEKINLDSMPLTQILNTKIDRVGMNRAAMTEALLKYLDTDLLFYRAPRPPELVEKQKESWDPWLAWFEKKSAAAPLTTAGLEALRQPEKAHKAAAAFVESLDDDRFTVLQMTAALGGSLILAMAFVEGEISAEEIFACARVEENHKAGIYNEALHGPDPAQEKKDKAALRDLRAAEKYLSFTKA